MRNSISKIKARFLLAMAAFSLLAVLTASLRPATAYAAVSPVAPKGQVSFTFDDGFESYLTEAAPVLAAHGQEGTVYISTGCISGTGDCRQNVDPAATFLTWSQVQTLKNTYGWEIGAHSANHPLMTELTPAQLAAEFSTSNQAFAAQGLAPTAFATPFGDYNSDVVAGIAQHYTSHRGFHDVGYNSWPYNKYILQVQQVQFGVSVATVKGYIDQAKANNTWLVLVFHDIHDVPSNDPEDYQYSTADLNEIAAYVQAQGIATANVTEGLTAGQNNLLPNSGFAAGLSGGWATDSPASVAANAAGHGNAPSAANSIAMTAAAGTNVHLFSPTIHIDPTKRYWVSGYANLATRQSGEFAVYVDEYGLAGNWISGQYKQVITDPQLKDVSFIYQASSAQVAKASLQFIVSVGSGITAYVDNVEWYSVEQASDPDPDPEPTNMNVLPNSNFNNGIADGWTTDNPTALSADTAHNGSPASPQYSVKLTAPATAGNAHLFAPKVTVQSDVTYMVKAFLNILTLNSGEVALYIDEYDDAGNWISGQYLYARRLVGTEEVDIAYVPSSANVRQASLQIIVGGNSGITGYLDEVQFLAPVTNPDPTPTPPILETTFANGIANGWTTDSPATITADANSHGAPDAVQHSVKLLAATVNTHLFSPHVAVTPGSSYSVQSYLNVVSLTSGEVAFYVDEYDAAGNWISGQYLYAKRAVGTETISFAYAPTSSLVASASLQVIVSGNSGVTAYLDSVKLTPAN